MMKTRILVLLLCFVGSVEHGSAQVARDDLAELATAVDTLGFDPASVMAPVHLNDEIRGWLNAKIPEGLPAALRARRLLEEILDEKSLGLKYQFGYTASVAEAFDSNRANCLAFTQLFVHMAREIGAPAFFVKVEEVTRYQKEQDLVIVSDHVTAGYDWGPDRRFLEFSILPQVDYRNARRITDLQALALFYSNRGAELIQSGDNSGAIEQLAISLGLDAQAPAAWVNIGVARRRAGDLISAEEAYRWAIQIDENHISAYQNLSALLRIQGKRDPAREVLRLLDRRKNRNPFIYLQLGDDSLRSGHMDEAKRFYLRAVRLGRDHAESHAALGRFYLGTGRTEKAAKQLRKAEEIDRDESRTIALRDQLDAARGRASPKVE